MTFTRFDLLYVKTQIQARFYHFLSKCFLRRTERRLEIESWHLFSYNRKNAVLKLIQEVPMLFTEPSTWIVQGIHSWEYQYATKFLPPSIDLVFNDYGLIFILLESRGAYYATDSFSSLQADSSDEAFSSSSVRPEDTTDSELLGTCSPSRLFEGNSDQRELGRIFRFQIRESQDPIPLVPIVLPIDRLLGECNSLEELSALIDHAWGESLRWILAQLPNTPIQDPENPTPAQLKRAWAEEALLSSRFPVD